MNECVCVVVDLREIGYSWFGRETRVSFAARNGRRLVVFVSFLVQQRITRWLVGWCWTGPKTVRSIPRRPTTPVAETKLGFRPRPHEIIRKQIPLLQSSIPAFEIYTLTMYGPTALRYAVTMSAPAGYMKQDNFRR
jgi:hypothetical protein